MFLPFGAASPLILIGFLACLVLGIYASFKTQSTYAKFSRVGSRSGLVGAQVAREILDRAGLEAWAVEKEMRGEPTTRSVQIEMVSGMLSDHYDPIQRVLRLSPDVYHGSSLAACGVAAHEAGHAVQHAKGFVPLHLRTTLYPLAAIGSKAWPFLMMLGWMFGLRDLGILLSIGIVMFSFAVAFYVITLPVEFDASRRAMVYLREYGILATEELSGARKVLTAAALTYVAAALTAVIQLLYLLSLRRDR